MGDIGSLALGGAMAGLALLTNTDPAAADPRRPLRVRDAERDRAGDLVPRASTGASCAWRRSTTTSRSAGWPEFTVIVRFWLLAGLARRARARLLLRRLHPHPRGARLMRVLVVGLGATGDAVGGVVRSRAGHDVTVVEDAPGPATRTASARRARGGRRRRACSSARRRDAVGRARARPPTSSCPSPGVPPDHPALVAAHAAGVPVRSEIDLAAARLRARPDAPRLVAVTGTNGKTTVTTLIDGDARRRRASRSAAAGNIGRPLLDAAERRRRRRRRRGVVVPARAHHRRVRARRRGAAQRRRGPPRLARLGRRVRRGQGRASSRTRGAGRCSSSTATTRSPRRSPPTRPARVDPVRHRRCRRPATTACADGDAGRSAGRARRRCPTSGAPHDLANALAAAAAALAVGADVDRGDARRSTASAGSRTACSWSASAPGCSYFDDSKATNPHATAGALPGFEHVVLIAGGRNKGARPRRRCARRPRRAARGRRHR